MKTEMFRDGIQKINENIVEVEIRVGERKLGS